MKINNREEKPRGGRQTLAARAINPFTALACKISGLKDAQYRSSTKDATVLPQ